MKLTIVSDMHVDIRGQSHIIDWDDGDVLVVAGDTSNSPQKTAQFLNEKLNFYEYVIYVDGNHEHYSNSFMNPNMFTIEDNLKYLDSITEKNVIRLHGDQYFDYGDYRFVGNCGWYTFDYYSDDIQKSVDLWKQYSNDWSMIYEYTPKQFVPDALARVHSAALMKQIAATPKDKKIIVVTHTVPHTKMLDYRPEDQFWEQMSAFYYNSHNREILENEDIMLWINGHTHLNKYMEINGTTCICNPRGYPGENPSWKPLVIDL